MEKSSRRVRTNKGPRASFLDQAQGTEKNDRKMSCKSLQPTVNGSSGAEVVTWERAHNAN